jgi:DNA-binding IclR family transcriptional regulator
MDEVEAALCISGPAFRMTSAKTPELGRLVKQVADEVSKEMGHTPPW